MGGKREVMLSLTEQTLKLRTTTKKKKKEKIQKGLGEKEFDFLAE